MSRIGRKPVAVPKGVKVSVTDRTVSVEGPRGKLQWTSPKELTVRFDEQQGRIEVARSSEDRRVRSLHGLTRSLIANMVEGCLNGFAKSLEVYGVGYSVQLQGNRFILNCGLSHPVAFDVPEGLTVEVKTPQARGEGTPAQFTITGADKQAVGELAARIRKARPAEPYKGKGVRYVGERIRRKVGKAFAGTGKV